MFRWLRWFGSFLVRVFQAAEANGLTDDIQQKAIDLARQAAGLFADNEKRREWAVIGLQEIGVPESIARLAVELAVQFLKREAT
jgi:hypothetical protein